MGTPRGGKASSRLALAQALVRQEKHGSRGVLFGLAPPTLATRMQRLLDADPDRVTLDDLRAALDAAGDEDERFEIKDGRARAEQVQKAIAGLANRDGGVVVLGAEQMGNGAWRLTGRQVQPGQELGVWVTQQVEGHLKPVPQVTIRVLELAPASVAAILWVAPHADSLVVRSDGVVFRREHGSTLPVQDGRRLAELIRERAGQRAVIALDAPADAVAASALAAIDGGSAARLRASVTALRGRIVDAAQFRPHDEFLIECDRLAATAAALLQGAPEDPVTALAIRSLQEAVDDAAAFPQIPGGSPDLDVYRHMRIRARALGALMVRFGLWSQVRALVAHQAPRDDRLYPGWLTFIAYKESEARPSPSGDGWGRGIREAAATAERLQALRPDGAHANAILESVLTFDVAAAVLDLDAAERARQPLMVETAFALFDAAPSRQFVRRLLDDATVRDALLPGRRLRDVARVISKLDELASQSVASTRFWDGLFDVATSQRIREMVETVGAPSDVRG